MSLIKGSAKPRGYHIRATRLALRRHVEHVSATALSIELEKPKNLVVATLRHLEEDGEVRVRHDYWRLIRR